MQVLRNSSVRRHLRNRSAVSSLRRPDHVRFTPRRRKPRVRLPQWALRERHSLDSVLGEECRYAASQSSSVAPEWARRNPASVRRWLRGRAVQCIRRVSRLRAVLWDWARQAWLRHRRLVLVLRDVRVRLVSVQGSVMFRVG